MKQDFKGFKEEKGTLLDFLKFHKLWEFCHWFKPVSYGTSCTHTKFVPIFLFLSHDGKRKKK